MSQWLAYGEWACGHDELRHCRSLDDVASWWAQPTTGTVETAASPFWRLIPDGVRVVTVRRDIGEVLASLRNAGLAFDPLIMAAALWQQDRKLEQLAKRRPGVLAVRYDELASEEACRAIWRHCLPYEWDHEWWDAWQRINVQINIIHESRYWQTHWPQLQKLVKVAKHRTLTQMRHARHEIDGITCQVEPWGQFYRDAQPLFCEHLTQIGEAPDSHLEHLNVGLLAHLDAIGWLQCMTARCNGRLAGYLMAVITPSLESAQTTDALHTMFFVDPDFAGNGLGLKLQQASLDALRARGVDEVFLRAGYRGSGPRLGVLYRRMGAVEIGQLYRLEL